MISRRKILIGGTTALGSAGLGLYMKMRPKTGVPTPPQNSDLASRAKALITKVPSFDLHAHPGRTFVKGAKGLTTGIKAYAASGSFEEKTIAGMVAGGMNAATFCTVADFQILDLVQGKGLIAIREFEEGEAWASYLTQMRNLKALTARGLVTPVYNTSDILRAKAENKVAALNGSEGGDFLGGSIERLRECYQEGTRVINPMHYHHNEIGDIMTETPHHNGLTKTGRKIIKEMNALGMVIDGAHASLDSLSHILDVSDHPILCSHTHILSEGQVMPRFITKELALRIAKAGGVIGAWPAGIGISTLDGFVSRILELVEIVGVDHVGLGTDMDANYKPVWDDYSDFPLVVTGLMQRGLTDADIAKIIGGNGLRVLSAVTGD